MVWARRVAVLVQKGVVVWTRRVVVQVILQVQPGVEDGVEEAHVERSEDHLMNVLQESVSKVLRVHVQLYESYV